MDNRSDLGMLLNPFIDSRIGPQSIPLSVHRFSPNLSISLKSPPPTGAKVKQIFDHLDSGGQVRVLVHPFLDTTTAVLDGRVIASAKLTTQLGE